jgi:glycosyltransferase involved in cell wall biosynthesis
LGQGRDYHVHKWLPALAEQGLEVTLISYTPPDRELSGVKVITLEPPVASTWEDLSIRDFWGSARPLKKILEDIKADVLMASYGTNYGWLGVRTGFRPLIAQTWTNDISVYPWTGWKRWVFRPMVRKFLREADIVTTDGQALADELNRRFSVRKDKVVAVRWGIRLSDYAFSADAKRRLHERLGIPEDAVIVTSSRGVRDVFRAVSILKAFERVLDSHPHVHGLFLTLGKERSQEVQSLLDRFGEHPRGYVCDRFLSTGEIQEVWSATDLLVSVPAYDGVSESLLEGMYAGCIPLVSSIPSNHSFLEPDVSGVFVEGDPDDPDVLASAVFDAVKRLPNLKERMVDRNRQWIEREASVEASAQKVADLVRGLASNRRASTSSP